MADAIKPLAGGGSRAASALSPLRPFSALSWSGLEDAEYTEWNIELTFSNN